MAAVECVVDENGLHGIPFRALKGYGNGARDGSQKRDFYRLKSTSLGVIIYIMGN
jgi:hypothetical protein